MTIRRNAPAVFYIYTDGTGEITEQIPFEYLSSGDVHSQVARTDGRVIDPSKLHYFSSNRPGGVIERAKAFSGTNRWILIFENSLPFARAQGGFESAQLFSPSSMSVFLSEETSSGNFGSTQTPAFLYFSGGARNEFKFYVMAGGVTFPTTVAGGTYSSTVEQGPYSYATYTLPEEFDFNVGDFFSVAEIPVTNKIGKKTLDITRITIPVVTVTDIYSLASSDLYDSSTVNVALFDNTKFYVKVFRHTERTQLREFTDPGLEEAIDEMFLINQEQDSKGPIPGYGDEFISGAGYNDSVLKQGVSANKSDIAINKAGIAKNKLNTGRNVQAITNQGISISTNKTDQTAVDVAQNVKIETNKDAIAVNTADIAALPTGTAITGQISADEAKITANEGNIATNTTNIATNTTNIGKNAHEITSLSTGSVQSNINAVVRLGGQINTLDEKVFTTSSTPGVADTDNILTNKNAIAKNKADIAATPSLVAHDAKEDKILRLTSSPNSPVAPSLLTAVTSGFVDPIYSTRVDFTSLVYNSTPPIQYTLALTEAPSLRIVQKYSNRFPEDAIFFPEGSLYVTSAGQWGNDARFVPQTITLTFPNTVVVYTLPTKEPETITVVGPHFTVVLEKYTYNFSGTAHALIPIGVGGVITTTGGTFDIDDMDVVEGNEGQRIIQVSVDKKLDIIWEKETTGVVADWFKLSTVGLDVVSNASAIVAVEGDLNVYKGRIGLEGTAQEKAARVGKLPRVKAGGVTFDYIDEPSGGSGASKFVDLTDTEATVGSTDDIMTTKASGLIGPAPLVVHESNLDAGLQKHFLTPRAPVTTAKGSFKETVLLESYVGHGRSKKRATATQDSAYKSASAAFPLDTNVVLSTKMSHYIRTNDIRKAGDFWGDAYAIYNGSFWSGQYGDVKRAIRGATPRNPTAQDLAENALVDSGYQTMAVHDETLWVASAYPGANILDPSKGSRYDITTKVKRILNNKVITGYVKVNVPYHSLTKITSGVMAATYKYLWIFVQYDHTVYYTRCNPEDITISANGKDFTFNNTSIGQFVLGSPRHNVKLRFAFGNSRDIYLQFTKQFGTDWTMGNFREGGTSDNVNYNYSKCGTVTRSDTKGCYKMVDMDVSDTADIPAHAYNTANFKDFPNTNKLIKMAACYSPREFRTFFIVNNTYAAANREAIAYTTTPNSASLDPVKGGSGQGASFAVPDGSLLYALCRDFDASRSFVEHDFFTVPIGEIDYSRERYQFKVGSVVYWATINKNGNSYSIGNFLPGLKVSILTPKFLLDTEIPRSLAVPFLAFGASNFVTVTKLPTIPDNYFFSFNYMFYQPNQGAFTEVFEVGKVTGLSAGPIKIMRDNVQNFGEVNMRTAIAANAREAQLSYGHNAKNFYIHSNRLSIVGLKTNIDTLTNKTVVVQWEIREGGVLHSVEIESNLLKTFANYNSTPNIGTSQSNIENDKFTNRYSDDTDVSVIFAKKGSSFIVLVDDALLSGHSKEALLTVHKRRHDQLFLGLSPIGEGDVFVRMYNLKVFYKDMTDAPAFATGTDRRLEFTITSGEILAYTTVAGGNTGPGVLHINNFSMTKN